MFRRLKLWIARRVIGSLSGRELESICDRNMMLCFERLLRPLLRYKYFYDIATALRGPDHDDSVANIIKTRFTIPLRAFVKFGKKHEKIIPLGTLVALITVDLKEYNHVLSHLKDAYIALDSMYYYDEYLRCYNMLITALQTLAEADLYQELAGPVKEVWHNNYVALHALKRFCKECSKYIA